MAKEISISYIADIANFSTTRQTHYQQIICQKLFQNILLFKLVTE